MKEDIEYIFNTLNEMKIEDSEKFISAVSNMFFDYKKLKRENQMLKNTKNNCPFLNTSGVSCNTKNDYISKDKIKEKLNYQYELWNSPTRQKEYSQDIVNILEELLEEET